MRPAGRPAAKSAKAGALPAWFYGWTSVLPILTIAAFAADVPNVTEPGQVWLAPDGKYIAASVQVPGLPGVRNLVTMLLSDSSAKAITGFSDAQVDSFFWASDERLVFSLNQHSEQGAQEEYRDSFSIQRDGSGGRKLQSRRGRHSSQAGNGAAPRLLHRLPTNRNNVLISRIEPRATLPEVFLLDVSTGRSKKVLAKPSGIATWIADNSGAVRAAIAGGGDMPNRLLYRDSADDEWRVLRSFDDGDLEVLGFHTDNQRMIVLVRGELDGTALHLLDKSGELSKRLFSDPEFGLSNRVGAVGLKQTALGLMVFYQYMADRLRTVYFDTRWELRQQKIDEALAHTTNTIVDWSDDERSLLIHATDGEGASDYYLFDTTYRELTFLQPPATWVK